MSHEFSPKAPEVIGTESRVKSPAVELEGVLRKYGTIAKERYNSAMSIAEGIDDGAQTEIPFNRNAIYAAMMLASASLRAAEIS